MKNGRCRVHGGKSTGNPRAHGNTSAIKHGFYSDALLDDDERALYDRAAPGSVDDEIKLAKVKLHRYVKASGSVELQDMVDGALEVIRKQGSDMRGVDYDRRELKVAAPDYADLVIRMLDLIRKLELARVQLLKNGAGSEDGDAGDDIDRDDTVILRPDEPIPEKPVV
jgi:hypothetical protein